MKSNFTVKGMHCKSCEMLIADSLSELPGVKSVKADFKKGFVDVEHTDKVSIDKIKHAIKNEGYSL